MLTSLSYFCTDLRISKKSYLLLTKDKSMIMIIYVSTLRLFTFTKWKVRLKRLLEKKIIFFCRRFESYFKKLSLSFLGSGSKSDKTFKKKKISKFNLGFQRQMILNERERKWESKWELEWEKEKKRKWKRKEK